MPAAPALLLAAPPAAARIAMNTMGPTAAFGADGRAAVAEVLIDCTEDQADLGLQDSRPLIALVDIGAS